MTKDKQIEDLLIGENSLDELIKNKIEEDIQREIDACKQEKEPPSQTSLAELPEEAIFSKSTTWSVFNRKTKNESFINGLQVESFIGMNLSLRDRVLKDRLESFLVKDYFIKYQASSTDKSAL